jgi:hypothetical protein
MSIFGNIMGAIFGHAQAQPAQTPQAGVQSAPAGQAKAAPASQSQAASASGGTTIPFAPPGQQAQWKQPVDVEATLDNLAAQRHAKLDWRVSIVDLMKLLDLDSSLSARKELAKELHYTGNMDDSASMNIWLHKQVMTKLAENGGKVPENLKH